MSDHHHGTDPSDVFEEFTERDKPHVQNLDAVTEVGFLEHDPATLENGPLIEDVFAKGGEISSNLQDSLETGREGPIQPARERASNEFQTFIEQCVQDAIDLFQQSFHSSHDETQAHVRRQDDVAPVEQDPESSTTSQPLAEVDRAFDLRSHDMSSDSGDSDFFRRADMDYMVSKFTQCDPELLRLYKKASQQLTQAQFVDINQHLLKLFYFEIAREVQTDQQAEATLFFKSRRRRTALSWDIFRTVVTDDPESLAFNQWKKEFSMHNLHERLLDLKSI